MAFLKRKRLKFNVSLTLVNLSDVPLVNAMLFAKVRLLDGGTFSGTTESVEVQNHSAQWNRPFNFSCRIASDPETGVLERCSCRVSLRKEQKGGKSYQKLGFVDLNLSEFAASGVDGIAQSYLLDGYGSHQRQDNSRLLIKVTMSHQCADPVFKVPRVESRMEEELLNPVERRAPPSNRDLSSPTDLTRFPSVQKINDSPSNESESGHSSSSEEEPHNHLDTPVITQPTPGPSTDHLIRGDAGTTPGFILPTQGSSNSLPAFDVTRRSILTSSLPQSRRLSQDRTTLGNNIDACLTATRMRATRVDAEDLIDRMLAETDIGNAAGSRGPSDHGLALFVSKNGEAVVATNSQLSTDSFEQVMIGDTSVMPTSTSFCKSFQEIRKVRSQMKPGKSRKTSFSGRKVG
ncbi:hypothetical protein AB6A40_006275 [Gnathostoma spinigerum]|uniref:C2 NT-type domain-containing protein n=1 Tax=Gnathostoma spinigerum TaxID=75299 RepID=A0ABD6EIK2_9BILA